VEEFLALHPEHADLDSHELMIARINHEHAEREKLEQARQELLKRKQALIAENKKRKDDLASLDQDLERFIDVCLSPFPSIELLFPPTDMLTIDPRQRDRSRNFLRRNTSRGPLRLLFSFRCRFSFSRRIL
jgi:hypothetical protein